LALESLVGESKVVLLLLGAVKVALSVAALTLEVIELSGQMVVTCTLLLKSLNEIALLSLLALERSLVLAFLVLEAGSFVPRHEEIMMACVVALRSLLEIVILVFRNLC